MNKTLLNFYNLEKPTTRQIIEVLKIIIKETLKITDDGYEINSITGAKTKKISVKPTEIDTVTDEDIITNIARTEAQKILASDELIKIIYDEIKKVVV